MSDKKKQETKKEKPEWNERAKEVWLAGLGALSAVEEEGSKLFRNLVDRGEEFESKRKEQISELWDEVSERYDEVGNRVGEKFEKVEETIEKSIRSVITEMGIPTRKEVEELSNKVDALIKKVDQMSEKHASSTTQKSKKGSDKESK